MNIFNKINSEVKHVQSLPEKEKVRVIWIMAIVIVAILAVTWVAFFRSYKISSNGGENQAIEDLKNNLENQFKDKFGGKLEIPKIEIPQNIPSETPKNSL